MSELNLPKMDTKITKKGDIYYIWDKIRKKHIILTPEEWVRQHFVNYLINTLDYPESHIANEIEITLNRLKKRCDTIVYDSTICPRIIIEYKAPSIPITQETFNQILRYNIVLHVEYLIISNGLNHHCCKVDYKSNSIEYLSGIPLYEEIDLKK